MMKNRTLLTIFTLFAIIMTFIGVQKPFVSPLPFGLKTDEIYAITSSPKFSVIIDSEERRVLFLNGKGQLVKVLDKNTFSTVEYFYDCKPVIDGDYVWLLESESEPNDVFISEERLVRYNAEGKFSGTVLEWKYDFSDMDDYHYSSAVWKYTIEGDKGLAYISTGYETGYVLQFSPHEFGTGSVISTWKPVGNYGKIFNSEDIFIPFSPLFAILNSLFWLSVLYLVLLIVFLFSRCLYKLFCNKDFAALKKLGIKIGFVAVATTLVLFYSFALNKLLIEEKENAMMLTATELRNRLHNLGSSIISDYHAGREIDKGTKDKVIDILDKYSINAKKSGFSYLPMLYTISDDGNAVCLSSALDEIETGQKMAMDLNPDILEVSKNLNRAAITKYKNSYMYSLVAVAPYEELNGGILILDDFFSLKNAQMLRNFTLIVIVISISLAIASLISELRFCLENFKLLFKSRKENNPHPEFHLVRPLYFTSYAAIAAIFIMGTLIGKDIIGTSPLAGSAFIMSLPLSLIYAGTIAAFILFSYLAKRISRKSIVMYSSVIALFSYAALAVATARCNLFFYLFFIFTSVTATGMCFSYVFSLILFAPDKSSMNDANRSRVAAELSSSIIVGIAAGYIADYIGNCWTFILSIFFMILNIVMVLCLISKDKKPEASEKVVNAHNKKLLKFMLSPGMIMVFLCTVIPYCIAYTYSDFVFPILASSKGLSKSIISTITVMAFALASYVTPAINKKFYDLGFRRSASYIAILLAIFYAILIFTDSLFTLIVFMPIFYTISANSEVIPNMLWPKLADKALIPRDDVNSKFLITDQMFRIFSTPCVGALLSIGQAIMFISLAGYMFISGFAYRIFCRKEDK